MKLLDRLTCLLIFIFKKIFTYLSSKCVALMKTVFQNRRGSLKFNRFLCSSFPQIVPKLIFALITTFPISFSPLGETHCTGCSYIAPSCQFFCHEALTMHFYIKGFAVLS